MMRATLDSAPARQALGVALLATLAIAGACTSQDATSPVTEGELFLNATPSSATAQQGEEFRITVTVVDDSGASINRLPVTYDLIPPEGVEIVTVFPANDKAVFVLRGLRPGSGVAILRAPEFDDVRVPVTIAATTVATATSLPTGTANGKTVVPMLPGEELTAQHQVVDAAGCPMTDGSDLATYDFSPGDEAFWSEAAARVAARSAGCGTAAGAAVESTIQYQPAGNSYDLASTSFVLNVDPSVSASVTVLGLASFETDLVAQPTPIDGTGARTNAGTCDFVPGGFDVSYTLRQVARGILEVLAPDGSPYTQTRFDAGIYTLRSEAREVEPGVDAVETIDVTPSLIRSLDDDAVNIALAVLGTITLIDQNTTDEICTVTADIVASGPLVAGALDHVQF